MRRISTRMCLVPALISAVIASAPGPAAAGGSEFPASGTRNLGRGGSGLTRADDPTVMLRNPALLADLWEDMAYSGVHVLVPDSCFQATGNYTWTSQVDDAANFGDGPVLVNIANASLPDGTPLPNIRDEAFPRVCYDGPVPILPNIALTMKLAPNIGVGLGFFPPDNAALAQWGNRNGTVDTANGLRPSPTRWFRSHLNTSYFSALGAIGYRPTSWLRIGFGFQWALVVYSATEFTRPAQTRTTSNDVRVDITGRDLFIPGLIGSVHATPIDNLDIAIGFKWSDRVKSQAKLDITTSYFGSGRAFRYVNEDGMEEVAPGLLPLRSDNRLGTVDSPPVWVPELSFGVRYADRLAPRATTDNETWQASHRAAGRNVDDAMATERWDIELNAVVVFNGFNNYSRFVSANEMVGSQSATEDGSPGLPLTAFVGQCTEPEATCAAREVPRPIHGKTQLSLRLGGEYNLMPGLFAVRGGLSYETDGQDPGYLNVTNYQLGRTGLHVGVTFRFAGKTDFSIAYAHFFQRSVALTVNPARPFSTRDPGAYHVVEGEGDGVAQFPIADSSDSTEGPLFANAGTFYYHLDVVSVALAQHF
ncbi:MAG: hypothetical protein ABW321_10775 [Polyangiales bacterium]